MSGGTLLEWLSDVSPEQVASYVERFDKVEIAEWPFDWQTWARPNQLPPQGDWRIWLIMAGRGFGKTRLGAEWVRRVAEENPDARIALVGSSLHEARSVMVEGESGLLSIGAPWRRPTFESSVRRLVWPNGAQAHLYSAAEPESLRGPQHSHASRSVTEGASDKRELDDDRYAAVRRRSRNAQRGPGGTRTRISLDRRDTAIGLIRRPSRQSGRLD